MTDIEYQGKDSLWKLGSLSRDEIQSDIPRLRIPVMRYQGVTIWRSLTQWVVVHKQWTEINGVDRKLVYVMCSPDLKGLKQMIDVFRDSELTEKMGAVLIAHADRGHLENCLKANETVTGQSEPTVATLEIKFTEVDDENAPGIY